MRLHASEEQLALATAVRRWCEGALPLERLRGFEGRPDVDAALWNEIAELGVFAILRETTSGGLGLGAAEAMLVFEELGRGLVPGPLVWSHLAGSFDDEVARGASVAGGLELVAGDEGPWLVEHAQGLDLLVIMRPDRVEVAEADDVAWQPIDVPLDPLTPLARTASLPRTRDVGGPELVRSLRLQGGLCIAAGRLGSAERCLDLAVAHAMTREQFGRPVGSYQALKHMMADMFARQELARGALHAAAAELAGGPHGPAERGASSAWLGPAERAVSSAWLVAADAAEKNARAAIQIHGGMGYTWEIPLHYHLKRTWVTAHAFGNADDHALHLAEQVGVPDRPGQSS